LCLEASIADNIALVTLPRETKSPLRFLDMSSLNERLGRIREAVQLQRSLRLEQPARTLSGGNQQKVVLAKWLLTDPEVLILDEPTRGIDVGARFEIYQLILGLADRGAGILKISSEIEELIGLCDRIIVLSRGKISSEFSRAEFDREEILRAALQGNERSEAMA
ncbi:MAG TPA: ATP-binding cassette domain-containing protein, partial [Candidatus Kapabacteria bacterium]|nr:ATP-binding cassette domain-containing protein [Candidatus Kapabacteria bacterium]